MSSFVCALSDLRFDLCDRFHGSSETQIKVSSIISSLFSPFLFSRLPPSISPFPSLLSSCPVYLTQTVRGPEFGGAQQT